MFRCGYSPWDYLGSARNWREVLDPDLADILPHTAGKRAYPDLAGLRGLLDKGGSVTIRTEGPNGEAHEIALSLASKSRQKDEAVEGKSPFPNVGASHQEPENVPPSRDPSQPEGYSPRQTVGNKSATDQPLPQTPIVKGPEVDPAATNRGGFQPFPRESGFYSYVKTCGPDDLVNLINSVVEAGGEKLPQFTLDRLVRLSPDNLAAFIKEAFQDLSDVMDGSGDWDDYAD